MKPGIFHGIPMAEYQAWPAVSKSQLDVLHRSPLDLHRQQTGQTEREETDAMRLGTAFHAAILENRRDYVMRPAGLDGRTKEGKAWLAENAGKLVVPADFEASVDYARQHPQVAQLLAKPGQAEVSLFGAEENYGTPIKGRADWLWTEGGQTFIADIKTTVDASTRAFSREILSRRYHVQAAMYRYILTRLGHDFGGWYFIALEKGSSPKCNVRVLAADALELGEAQLMKDLSLYRRCSAMRHWPEWADWADSDAIQAIDLPPYAYGDGDILTGMTATTTETA